MALLLRCRLVMHACTTLSAALRFLTYTICRRVGERCHPIPRIPIRLIIPLAYSCSRRIHRSCTCAPRHQRPQATVHHTHSQQDKPKSHLAAMMPRRPPLALSK
ncbi:hypothetical protein F5X68DRAFT_42400 [Plectosphaerella plurivora]|uniref:Secreted protein n=1 Tax=Plectosphaerella plurivora TaxID=936078 RepID=A0A9P8V5H6_9PEZI|nr:hypothetical protein F5X68DRAFT_42400 [Plectosphaerella plurivora]